jgi:hypothetical protein
MVYNEKAPVDILGRGFVYRKKLNKAPTVVFD